MLYVVDQVQRVGKMHTKHPPTIEAAISERVLPADTKVILGCAGALPALIK